MQKLKSSDAHVADRDILRGPPGLLFGLTLLILGAARLCFGWDVTSASQDDPTPTQVAAANALDPEPSLTHAAFID